MKKIIIIGGGGFGREIFQYIKLDIDAGILKNCVIAGIVDDNPNCELILNYPDVAYIGNLTGYKPACDEAIIIAVGRTTTRAKIYATLEALGGIFFSYVHSTAIIAPDAIVEESCIICPNTVVNAGARVGKNSAINVFCSIGHGASIGKHSVLSPYCSMSGDSALDDMCFMGTRATLFPNVKMGKGCIVDAHTAVKKTVGDGKIVSMRGNYLVLDNRLRA